MSDKKKSLLGAHVSVAGGYTNGLIQAEKIGASVIQIFGSSPRQWKVRIPSRSQVEDFLSAKEKSLVSEVYLHAPYLINLGSPNKELYEKSVAQLTGHMQIGNMIKAKGVIFHVGSSVGTDKDVAMDQAVDGMRRILEKVSGDTALIMENSASSKKLGVDFKELGDMLRKVDSERVKICFDTAHAFGAGLIDEYSEGKIEKLLEEFNSEIGLENLVAIHINDSKAKTGTNVDRHENIGQGFIGRAGFKRLLANKSLSGVDWILEVPGFEGGGPDKKNMDILRSLVK